MGARGQRAMTLRACPQQNVMFVGSRDRGSQCTRVHRKPVYLDLVQWSGPMELKMRSLMRWSAAPAKNVETAVSPKVNMVRGLVARATTPLLPDDYLKLLNPLWSARGLRGVGGGVCQENEKPRA